MATLSPRYVPCHTHTHTSSPLPPDGTIADRRSPLPQERVTMCPPSYLLSLQVICSSTRFMLIALYACGHSTGSRPGDSLSDQIDCIHRYTADHLGAGVRTTEFKDLDPTVAPLRRPGIQCLLQWLDSAEGEGATVYVAHAKYLFSSCAEACGELTAQLRNDLHFVRERLHAGTTADRHVILTSRIRSALALHAHDRERQRKRRQHAMALYSHGSTQPWYGYRKVTRTGNDIFVPEDSELRVVHLCHDLRWVPGYTPLRIMEELERSQDVNLSRRVVSKIIHRPRPKDGAEWAFMSPIFLDWVTKRRVESHPPTQTR
jgi:hypothetical protein